MSDPNYIVIKSAFFSHLKMAIAHYAELAKGNGAYEAEASERPETFSRSRGTRDRRPLQGTIRPPGKVGFGP